MTNLTDKPELQCSACGTDVASENVNYAIGVAKCSECDSVFQFKTNSAIEEEKPNDDTQHFLNKMLQSQYLIHISLLVFMVFWNISFLIFIIACVNKGYIALSVILGVVTIIGIYLTYFVVTALFGSATISSPNIEIGKMINPFSIMGGGRSEVVVANLHLRGAFSEQYQFARNQNQRATAYRVKGINRNGDTMDLVSNVSKAEHALEIEEKIKDFIHPASRQKSPSRF